MRESTLGVNVLSRCRKQIGIGLTRGRERKSALRPAAKIVTIVLVAVAAQPGLGCEHGCEVFTPSFSSDLLKSYGSYTDHRAEDKAGSGRAETLPAGRYATQVPKIYSDKGEYVGKFSKNRYDHESLSNPYGRYGNRYASGSLFNPYGRHGTWSGRKFLIVPPHGEPEVVSRDQILRSLSSD